MKTSHTFVAWLVGAFLLSTAVVVPSFWVFRQTKEAAEARMVNNDFIARAECLVSELIDAETGQRGYLLTDEEVFLEPYTVVRGSISEQVVELRRLTSLRTAQDHLDKVAPMVDAKLAYLLENIEFRHKGDMPAALANVRGSQGKP